MRRLVEVGIFKDDPFRVALRIVDRAEDKDRDFFHPKPPWLTMAAGYGPSSLSGYKGPWLRTVTLAVMAVRENLEQLDPDNDDRVWMAAILEVLINEAKSNAATHKLGELDVDELLNATEYLDRLNSLEEAI
jgi:hypothetical protein